MYIYIYIYIYISYSGLLGLPRIHYIFYSLTTFVLFLYHMSYIHSNKLKGTRQNGCSLRKMITTDCYN